MKTAYAYLRISNEDQSNFSISGQRIVIEEWAKKRGIKIVGWFIDDGYSAKDFNRPDWKRLEIALSKGGVDFLIVMKYDRMIRDVVDGLGFIKTLEQKWNVALISVMENYSIDIHDPYFFKHRADMFVDAEFERRRISDRTRFGQWSAKLQGRFIGIAPYGYQNAKDSSEKPIIVVDKAEAKIVNQMFDDFLNGEPQVAIMKRAIENGFNQKGKDAFNRIICNQVYAGLIKTSAYKDDASKIVKGIHEPIMTEEKYWKAYYKMKEQSQPVTIKIFDENIPLRGFLLCEHCGGKHAGAKSKGRSAYYYYYWCQKCRGKNYNAQKVHIEISQILSDLSMKQNVVEAIRAEYEIQLNETTEERKEGLIKAEREYGDLKKRLDSLEKKYIEDKIEHETYQKWYSTYKKDINQKSVVISDLKRDDQETRQLLNDNLPYLTDLTKIYNRAAIEDKHSFLKEVFLGGLYKELNGYRTGLLNDLLSTNAPQIGGLLTVKNWGNSQNLQIPPLGSAMEPNSNQLLRVIERIMKAA